MPGCSMKKKKKELSGKVFCLSGTLSQPHNDLQDHIENHGGEISASVAQRVDFLISTKADVKSRSSKVQKAIKEEIPIVKESFISDSIKNGGLVEQEGYLLIGVEQKKKPKEEEEEEESSQEEKEQKNKKDSSSQEESSEEEEDVKPKKRARTPAKSSGAGSEKKIKTESGTKKVPKVEKQPKQKVMTPESFLSAAKPLSLKIEDPNSGQVYKAQLVPRKFSSGGYGWHSTRSSFIETEVDDLPLKFGTTVNLVVRRRKINAPKVIKKKRDQQDSSDVEDSDDFSGEPESEDNLVPDSVVPIVDESSSSEEDEEKEEQETPASSLMMESESQMNDTVMEPIDDQMESKIEAKIEPNQIEMDVVKMEIEVPNVTIVQPIEQHHHQLPLQSSQTNVPGPQESTSCSIL
eukprot:TRINITY_DN706_c0_g1_i1.p1 TRINITY_DN706_c0_g1~~TRINITY_DN706_c0_g1_i1.p1  ORF type:complete len:406 (-),score=127.37 TRINITY_DN706_c0_g1_i1:42-1259(-)